MMTNGPAATIGEILPVQLPRPRNRVELAEDHDYVHCRKQVLDFLYTRHGPAYSHSSANSSKPSRPNW
jgi:nitrate/nitrite transport system ATP-binding protein